MTQDEKFFKDVPEFLAAYDRILADGYLEKFVCDLMSNGGVISNTGLTIIGFIPVKSGSRKPGVTPAFTPASMIEDIKSVLDAGAQRVIASTIEITSQQQVVPAGTRLKLFLYIQLTPK